MHFHIRIKCFCIFGESIQLISHFQYSLIYLNFDLGTYISTICHHSLAYIVSVNQQIVTFTNTCLAQGINYMYELFQPSMYAMFKLHYATLHHQQHQILQYAFHTNAITLKIYKSRNNSTGHKLLFVCEPCIRQLTFQCETSRM